MALLEEAARQLYREWFVRLRFPGHEHTRITHGVPEGWERTAFENALVLQRGFDLPIQAREDGDVYQSTAQPASMDFTASQELQSIGSGTGAKRHAGRSPLCYR